MTTETKPLFTLLDTPVTADPSALISPVGVFGVTMLLTKTDQPLFQRIRQAGFAVIAYEIADLIHTVGHILSARQAKAPMDEFRLQAPFPVTIYHDNDVSPDAHRLRAIGGPIASLVAGILTIMLYPFIQNKIGRDFVGISALLHCLLATAIAIPLPFIDGGALLKWTLVKRGRTPDAADAVVEEANILAGGLSTLIGSLLLIARFWKSGILLILQGIIFIGVGLGLIKR